MNFVSKNNILFKILNNIIVLLLFIIDKVIVTTKFFKNK